VVQQATRAVVEPLFLPCSFGYRPGRSAQGSAWWVREAINRGDRWVAEFDIVGFFDHIRHGRLLRELSKEVDDPEVVGLIRRLVSREVSSTQSERPGQVQGPGPVTDPAPSTHLHVSDGRGPAEPAVARVG